MAHDYPNRGERAKTNKSKNKAYSKGIRKDASGGKTGGNAIGGGTAAGGGGG